jgi:hypothetical protein
MRACSPRPPKSAVFGALAAQADPRAQRRRLRSRRIREKFSGESKDGYLSSLFRATAARLGVEAPPARRAHFLDPRRARREAPRRIARAERSQCKKPSTFSSGPAKNKLMPSVANKIVPLSCLDDA